MVLLITQFLGFMGSLFGAITVSQPLYKTVQTFPTFQIRDYPIFITAEIHSNSDNDSFRALAKYIGVFGTPENYGQEKMEMTAPVINS